MDWSDLELKNLLSRAPKDGGFDGNFTSPASSFVHSSFSASAPRKPSTPAARLSKPRMVKVRKHSRSAQVQPTAIGDADEGSKFNPLRYGTGNVEASAPEGNEDGVIQGLDEKLHGWKPFGSDAATGLPESKSSHNLQFGAGFAFGTNSVTDSQCRESGGFIFGSSAKNSSIPHQSPPDDSGAPNFDSGKSGIAPFVFGSRTTQGCASSFAGEKTGNFSKGNIYMDGSGIGKSDNSSRVLQINPEDPRLDSLGSGKSQNVGFSFQEPSKGNFEMKDIGSGNMRGSSGNEGIGKSDAASFVCGSGDNLCPNFGQSSSITSDDGTLSWLPDLMEKMSLQDSACEDGSVKTKKTYQDTDLSSGSNKYDQNSSGHFRNLKSESDMKSLKLQSDTVNLAKNSERTIDGTPAPFVFSSQVGKQDTVPNKNDNQPFETSGCFMSGTVSPTLCPQLFASESQSGSTHFTVTSMREGLEAPFTSSKQLNSAEEREEHLASATLPLDIRDNDRKRVEVDIPNSKVGAEKEIHARSFLNDKVSAPGIEGMVSKTNNVDLTSDATALKAEAGSLGSKFVPQVSESAQFYTFSSSLQSSDGSSSMLGPSIFTQGPLSASKSQHRRKNRMKGGNYLSSSSRQDDVSSATPVPNLFPVSNTFLQPYHGRHPRSTPSVTQGEVGDGAQLNVQPEAKKGTIPTDAEVVAEQEACEKWRLRGNLAYQDGSLYKAEEYYTRAVNCIYQNETSRSSISNRSLMLCYSNRAAARMSLGRMREALSDCMMAAAIDPSFLKAQVSAANCHLALGETEDAMKLFKKCLESNKKGDLDQKILVQASDGLQKTQQVANYMVQSEELLKRKSNEAAKALEMITDALSISPHSEKLMEKKADALFLLRRYDEVIQFCEQTMESAEMNHALTKVVLFENTNDSKSLQNSVVMFWRWISMAKSYFFRGKLEEALVLLKKHEELNAKVDMDSPAESSMSLFSTIHELLRLKTSGNEALQAGRYLQAVDHYTAALACNIESRRFSAICFCNRAAAYQALGQIIDAIADCNLAIALDASYSKALFRRASLHEMLRDYGQAANDLRRLISLLEKQSSDKANQSDGNDLNRACARLSVIEEEARKQRNLDMYMILGIEPSSSAADVKKAYRKAALKHHPDKAGQFLARSENLDSGLWKEVADEVHRDADKLFKMIGEAHNVLSDSSKRSQYNLEEEMARNPRKVYSKNKSARDSMDNYNSQFDKSLNRRYSSTYESSSGRWSGDSRFNRQF